ncbi:MAG: thymidine phosphorylase [Candidatus Eremiobacter antarcticus]|nr:thymidine phosphorylase [Candidatus Eremiobacteraeota bacterium]MBC5807019.1 thymidine phosphorylase [Candidatus Eremiobacteraeota bacterium]
MTSSSRLAQTLAQTKQTGGEHSPPEIRELIRGYQAGEIDDRLMTAWLQAVCDRGMSFEETTALTEAMAKSGRIIEWPPEFRPIVDKHSTGGVGDAVSLIAVPLAAACGARVAKLAGRALGHTGGTIDKLECIPALRSDLTVEEFIGQVARVGCAIAHATDELAPADKLLYALRNRTGTVRSAPLIAASVVSKKMAGGADAMVLDVTCGCGAFMRSLPEARTLGEMMSHVGRRLGRRVDVLITDMDQPLARSVGDALELDEALAVLENDGWPSESLRELAIEVAAALLAADGATAPETSRVRVREALQQGAGLRRFSEMVAAQGGRLDLFNRTLQPSGTIQAASTGVIGWIDAHACGQFVRANSAAPKGDVHRGGLRFRKAAGDHVERGEIVADIFGAPEASQVRDLTQAVQIGREKRRQRPLILDRF